MCLLVYKSPPPTSIQLECVWKTEVPDASLVLTTRHTEDAFHVWSQGRDGGQGGRRLVEDYHIINIKHISLNIFHVEKGVISGICFGIFGSINNKMKY